MPDTFEDAYNDDNDPLVSKRRQNEERLAMASGYGEVMRGYERAGTAAKSLAVQGSPMGQTLRKRTPQLGEPTHERKAKDDAVWETLGADAEAEAKRKAGITSVSLRSKATTPIQNISNNLTEPEMDALAKHVFGLEAARGRPVASGWNTATSGGKSYGGVLTEAQSEALGMAVFVQDQLCFSHKVIVSAFHMLIGGHNLERRLTWSQLGASLCKTDDARERKGAILGAVKVLAPLLQSHQEKYLRRRKLDNEVLSRLARSDSGIGDAV